MHLPEQVTVVEVGPRDGLQNESIEISTADKIEFVNRLTAAHLPVIEVSAFVSPKWVPQLRDAEAVLAGITKGPDTRYTALIPNMTGLERAASVGVREVAIVTAASDTFNRKNTNQDVEASLTAYAEVCRRATDIDVRVRAYVSTAFGCPYEGRVDPSRVADIAARLTAMGAFEVAISDTIGIAHPGQVPLVLDAVFARVAPSRVALHFHDTRGTALVNVYTALSMGVTTFDASAGGLGGCPYAPGAAGNLATDDLIYMLDGLGIVTGVSLQRLSDASAFIGARLGHTLPSRYAQAVAGSGRQEDSAARVDRH
jgi:isopropylmalate/homocitrate/citramalate synthase